MARPLAALWLLLAAAACDDTQSISVTSGELNVSVSASEVGFPVALRDDAPGGARVASLPCMMDACPTMGEVQLTCTGGVCDPAPATLTVPVGDVIDFDSLSGELSAILGVVDRIEITEIRYVVQQNNLSIDLEPVAIHWGPEGAAAVDPAMGVERLAVLPALPSEATPMGNADIDAVGQQALSDYLVGVSRRIRLFAQTEVDIDPGDDFPSGEVRIVAVLEITASGRLID